ncbi:MULTISPECIES: ABC transporter ATP-binding protein [Ramlibacter]|uniref:ABC transporter ATP-binding protein n=1 Tax=Ramlibacter aquaticus TaxID=2780094 RepID=A0ABR9SCM1_9BURK|nr:MULTISPECIES: ABC transporter ATP-binding protein [Ramlibacter]MBE7940106.1 ABC transporter ATP-binding protein [Ramlibacter aquaticus]
MLQVNIQQTEPASLQASLECAPGELVAVVGPSGAGKSTLLKSIAGLLPGARGFVRVGESTWLDSEHAVNVPTHERRVGFVFQSYALFPHMTVLENVMAAASGTGRDKQERAAAVLTAVRMGGMEGRRPGQLSGGQQQRVGLARALARSPEVLLLDEPFSAVDQMTRERLYEELAELRSTLSIPTLLVTHSIPEAQVLADRVVVLHHGKTLQGGTPEEVYRRPADAEVARLMGHKNVFSGELDSDSGQGLAWNGLRLEVSTKTLPGPVDFCVATDDVRLTDPGALPVNSFDARVLRLVPIGSDTRVYAELPNKAVVAFSGPKHVLRRRSVSVGETIRLTLPPQAVHVMPNANAES